MGTLKSQFQWCWHIRFNINSVRSKLSLPGTTWVKVWTSIRTGGSGFKGISTELSVLLAIVSIVVMIGRTCFAPKVAVSGTKLRIVTNRKKLGL